MCCKIQLQRLLSFIYCNCFLLQKKSEENNIILSFNLLFSKLWLESNFPVDLGLFGSFIHPRTITP